MLINWLFYLVMVMTFIATVYSFFRKKHIALSILNLIVLFSIPLVTFLNTIKLPAGTEMNYLLSSLAQGSLWAVYVTAGYLFMLTWWLVFLKKISVKPSNRNV